MITLFLMGLVCLVLTHYASRDKFPHGLEICFAIAAFFAAIHYNYGTDYLSYQGIFDDLGKREFDWYYINRKKYFTDIGWLVLCHVFKPIGFLYLVAFVGIVQNVIYYFFVREFVPKKWWVMAVFIYLFSENLYILNMSMMRQGFAASLFVLAFFFIQKVDIKKNLIAVGLVYIAYTIHGAAIFLFPCLLLVFLKKEWAPYVTIPILLLLVILFLCPDVVNNFLLSVEDLEEIEEYRKYYERGEARGFSIGIIWRLIPFFVSGYCCLVNKNLTQNELRMIILSMLGFVMIPFSLAIPMIGRMFYFFTPFMMASIPITYRFLPTKWMISLLGLEILYILYGYWGFFHSPTWMDSYYVFHSVFSVIL